MTKEIVKDQAAAEPLKVSPIPLTFMLVTEFAFGALSWG